MYCFFKSFIVGLFIQSIVLTITLLTGIGDGIVYLFYALPYILLFPLKQGEKKEISIFVMAILPSVIYAMVFALTVCVIKGFRNSADKKKLL